MASIAATNVLYPAYRNAVAGKTSDYAISTVMTNFTTTIFSFFDDNADVTPDDAHVFQSSYTAGENPAFATRVAMTMTAPTIATGVVDFTDKLFTTGEVVVTGDAVESYIIYKFITNAAASPVLAHYGIATGLPLTPNSADVTVVFNASGAWRF